MTTPFDDLLPKFPEEVALAAKECWEACKDSKVGDWMSHIHHAQWLETLDEPVENRIRFILENKDPAEHLERLRRLRPFDVKKLTPELREALATLDKLKAALNEKWIAYDKTRVSYYTDATADATAKNKAWNAYYAWAASKNEWRKLRTAFQEAGIFPEMKAIHAQVCGCPWGKDKDIFGGSGSQ